MITRFGVGKDVKHVFARLHQLPGSRGAMPGDHERLLAFPLSQVRMGHQALWFHFRGYGPRDSFFRNMLYIKALKKLAARKADLMGEGPMLSKRGLPGGDWLQGEGRRQRRRQAQKSFRNCYFR